MSHSILQKRFSAAACSALSCATLLFSALPAYASDTEVYTQIKPPAGEAAPAMVFMLDTSGSMAGAISSSNSTVKMTALKDAMKNVLLGGTVNGEYYAPVPGTIKVGLAQYHGGGNNQKTGKVVYPARPLDALTAIDVDSSDIQKISQGSDDAEQSGSLSLSDTTLDFAYNGATAQSVGLRFTDIDVPKGAKIIEAKIVLTASSTVSNSTGGKPQWAIQVEDSGNAVTYSAGSAVNSRTYNAVAPVTYIDGTWTLNREYELDVTKLMQLTSSRSDWCGGNAAAFRIQDVGPAPTYRQAYSYEADPSRAPKLVVYYTFDPKHGMDASHPLTVDQPYRYDQSCATFENTYSTADDAADWSNGTGFTTNNSGGLDVWSASSGNRRRVGVRFVTANISSSNSADITSAVLTVKARNAGSGLGDVSIKGFNQDNIGAFSGNLSAAVAGSGDSWPVPGAAITANSTYSFNVINSVKAVVGRSGFALDNAIGLLLTSASGSTATFQSRETDAANAPLLTLKLRVTNLNNLTTVRKQLNSYIQQLVADGGTPLGMSMMETASYMLGNGIYQQASTDLVKNAAKTSYVSPVNAEACVSNRLFLLTDGQPTTDDDMINGAKKVLGNSSCLNPGLGSNNVQDSSAFDSWLCMYQMANVLQDETSALNTVKKKIITSTMLVGEDLSAAQKHDLKAVAETYGGGKNYLASTPQALLDGIKAELDALSNQAGSFSAPGVAVNQFSRLNNLDQFYYAVFESPDAAAAYWPGNLKRYRLDINVSTGAATLVDFRGVNAVDSVSTFFKTDSWSWWNTVRTGAATTAGATLFPTDADGDKAYLGGSALKLPAPASRNMFTYINGTPNTYGTGPFTLTSINPALSTFRTAAKPILGTADDATTQNLLNWIKGYDIDNIYGGLVTVTPGTTGVRWQMGGALHSRPELVNYGFTGDRDLAGECPDANDVPVKNTSAGTPCTSANSLDNVVFFSTMEGVLHAVNTRTGIETFSFVPQETLSKMKTLKDNPGVSIPEFGLDLTWTVLRKDGNANGLISSSDTGDAVWLFSGMRMGGKNFYALDATNRAAPFLKWVITPSTSTAFSKMGQSWSQPTLATVKINNVLTTVLIFGGGYDDKHEDANYLAGADNGTTRGQDNDFYGNQVYIVNASTGALIAWTSNDNAATVKNSDIKFSIPAEIKVKDTNKDGLDDTLYFGDLGGQIFRVDLDNGNTSAAGLMKRVRRIAAVGVTESTAASNRRRFFDSPSVALIKNNGNPYVAIAIGSGHRGHPLENGVQDFFYVLNDKDALRPDILTIADGSLQAVAKPSDFAPLDLSASTGIDATTLASKLGFSVLLPGKGEKALASPLIFGNQVIFSTYRPDNTSTCAIVAGDTSLYRMSVLNGARTVNWGTGYVLTGVVKGLGPEPQLVVKDGKSVVVVGTKVIQYDDLGQPKLKSSRWHQKFKN